MSAPHALMEFHVSRAARELYAFDEALFGSRGRVIFANFAAARRFAAALNARDPSRGARAGDVNAMGLIDEVLHALIAEYRARQKPNLWREAVSALEETLGARAVRETLLRFVTQFPPASVYRGATTPEAYLNGMSGDQPHVHVALEEMVLLWLENNNPAFSPYRDLFADNDLRSSTAYTGLMSQLEAYLEAQEPFHAAGGLTLWRVLRLPALLNPGSLEGQLRMLLERFGGAFNTSRFADLLTELRTRTLGGLSLIQEEDRFLQALEEQRAGGSFGAGTNFGGQSVQRVSSQMLEWEPEAYTQDQSWMPKLVLLAKNAFVWLDQLRKIYGDHIQTLRDVPDAELEKLRSWGVTGLWLIGLWERSAASKEIKHRMGNPDAVASAYSLYDYCIAKALGDEGALEDLKTRAWRYGIRMASDMVPNHVGIDGKWVIEHPEWFLQTKEPPYPGYTFHSENLSTDSRVGIYLEDHYYAKTDAAVVFKRVDNSSGEARYLYHGNDGSGLPWNDTAQLDYLNADVREAVIQTILHVAKQFPVIRFDAAMTLAKRHIKRLWFPDPGSGEGIASRGEYGMTREQFDAAMPQEFWREVVDRAAVEAPDTLLLAEAFWMMEGYFVRSLGMHRVYNSAFMHMLRDEKNAEYRAIIRETTALEPEILKRYVNFLNNPDEKTAVEQFGKGDKYFGVMTLCATLPGLPMIGHGQIEGYAEKYGMEYQRAYYNETPDEGLIQHHHSQIFPLLKKRALFAETENFVFFDVRAGDTVLENVYAYSNARGGERALVLYNNSSQAVSGVIRDGQGAKRNANVTSALELNAGDGSRFALYRDLVTNLEFIKKSADLGGGMPVHLPAYGRAVLLDWREVADHDGRYARVARMLEGRGVESVEAVTLELHLERILAPWNALVSATHAKELTAGNARLLGELEARAKALSDSVEAHTGQNLDGGAFSKAVRERLARVKTDSASRALEAMGVIVTTELAALTDGDARALLDDWLLARQLERSFKELGCSPWDAALAVVRVKFLCAQHANLETPELSAWALEADAPGAIGVNRYEGVTYVGAERLADTLETAKLLVKSVKGLEAVQRAVVAAGYRVEMQAKGSTDRAHGRDGQKAKGKVGSSEVAAVEPVTTPSSKRPAKPKTPKTTSSEETPVNTVSSVTPEPVAKVAAPKTSSRAKKAVETPVIKTPAVEIVAEPVVAKTSSRKAAAVKIASEAAKATTKTSARAAKAEASAKPARQAAAQPVVTHKDDLTAVSGIGPKVATALEAGGIVNYAQLSAAQEADLRAILERAGIKLSRNLETWAAQATVLMDAQTPSSPKPKKK
jgi:predicted flap endonuclease-1-like 5' DNA nuclease/glycosidase